MSEKTKFWILLALFLLSLGLLIYLNRGSNQLFLGH